MGLRKQSWYLVLKSRTSPSIPLFSPDYGRSEAGSLLLFSEKAEIFLKSQPKKKIYLSFCAFQCFSLQVFVLAQLSKALFSKLYALLKMFFKPSVRFTHQNI